MSIQRIRGRIKRLEAGPKGIKEALMKDRMARGIQDADRYFQVMGEWPMGRAAAIARSVHEAAGLIDASVPKWEETDASRN